jgi:hypothetical protein
LDYSVQLLKNWKEKHENWVRENLNKSIIKTPSNIINVTSNNQNGGITAGIINIGKQKRILNDNIKIKLEQLLKSNEGKFEDIKISVQMGSDEGFEFGNQIQLFLKSIGFDSSIGQVQFSRPLKPIEISISKSPPRFKTNFNIFIGNQE